MSILYRSLMILACMLVLVPSTNAAFMPEHGIGMRITDSFRWQYCVMQPVPEREIDGFLFAVYESTPKIDRNVDFAWKDIRAAQIWNITLSAYVVGGMEPRFKRALYCMLRALKANGLKAGLTSGFRDNYRQLIAKGQKNAPSLTYHGGNQATCGYGCGLAVDIVSLMGDTREERLRTNPDVWKWVDRYGDMFGIVRPYGDHDAPHIAPTWSPESLRMARVLATRPSPAAQTTMSGSRRRIATK